LSTLCSIFSQVLKLIPRTDFDAAVREHEAERNAKGFTCWGQFVAMLFCQLGSVTSLRDITNGLAASEGKLRHLGLPAAPKRSTLACANAHRPCELFEDLFYRMLEVASSQARQSGVRHKFRFNNKLLAIDATTIELCAAATTGAGLRLTWTAKPRDSGYSAQRQNDPGDHLRQQTPPRIARRRPTRSANWPRRLPYVLSDQYPYRLPNAILDSSDPKCHASSVHSFAVPTPTHGGNNHAVTTYRTKQSFRYRASWVPALPILSYVVISSFLPLLPPLWHRAPFHREQVRTTASETLLRVQVPRRLCP